MSMVSDIEGRLRRIVWHHAEDAVESNRQALIVQPAADCRRYMQTAVCSHTTRTQGSTTTQRRPLAVG